MASLVSCRIARNARKDGLCGCAAIATHRCLCATQRRNRNASVIIVNNTTLMRLALYHHLHLQALVLAQEAVFECV